MLGYDVNSHYILLDCTHDNEECESLFDIIITNNLWRGEHAHFYKKEQKRDIEHDHRFIEFSPGKGNNSVMAVRNFGYTN